MNVPSAITRAAIIEYMREYPTGVKSQEIATRFGLQLSSTQHHLRDMKDAGTVLFIGSPGCGRWCAVEYQKESTQWVMGERMRLRKVRQKINAARRHTNVEQCVEAWCDTPPTKRLVRADQAKPLRVSGPNSVWALAA